MTSPGDRRLRLVVAEHAALDLAGVGHGGLDDNLAVERSGEVHRLAQAGLVLAFEMPTLDPRLAGLTNIGKRSARSSSAAIVSRWRSQSRRRTT